MNPIEHLLYYTACDSLWRRLSIPSNDDNGQPHLHAILGQSGFVN